MIIDQTSRLAPLTLVLGGARSGKSAFAEKLTDGYQHKVYLATGQAFDQEMKERIAQHQQRRGDDWQTIEAALELSETIVNTAEPDAVILVDCLTLWLSNIMHAERNIDAGIDAEIKSLVACLQAANGPIILVSNEVGLGIVPDNALARKFRDHAGILHQAVANIAQRVYFVVAGIPMVVKDR